LKGYNDERLMVTNRDRCLVAYPYDGWREIEQQFAVLSITQPAVLRYQRVFISGAMECACDKQGRILIPQELRMRAGLEGDPDSQEEANNQVVLVGMLNSFEIWSKPRWDQEDAKNLEEFDSLSQVMADKGM